MGLIFTIVVLGFLCWLLITYVPMPAPFPALVVVVAVLIVLALLFGGGGLGGLHFGSLGRC